MFCGKCGTSIPDNSEFCFKCGTPVPAQAKAEVEPTVQQAVPQPVAVQPEVKPVTNTVAVEKKKSKAPLIIGIVAGVVIIIGIIAVLCFMLFSKDEQKPTNGENNSTAVEETNEANNELKEKILGEWYCVGNNYDDVNKTKYLNFKETWIFKEDNTVDQIGDGYEFLSCYSYEITNEEIKLTAGDGEYEYKVAFEGEEMFVIQQDQPSDNYYRVFVRDINSAKDKFLETITGEWKIAGYQNPEDDGNVNNYSECPGTITFNDDNTYSINITDPTANTLLESHEGTYTFEENTITLTTEQAMYATFSIYPDYMGGLALGKDWDEGGIQTESHDVYFLNR